MYANTENQSNRYQQDQGNRSDQNSRDFKRGNNHDYNSESYRGRGCGYYRGRGLGRYSERDASSITCFCCIGHFEALCPDRLLKLQETHEGDNTETKEADELMMHEVVFLERKERFTGEVGKKIPEETISGI